MANAKTTPRRAGSAKKLSIAAQIVNDVISMLVKRRLQVGDFLGTEASICERFGASRFPVREALSRLEALGLVSIRRGVDGGVWIKEGDPDHFGGLLAVHFLLADISLTELFEARIAIVPKAAEHAARHATPEQIKELHLLLQDIERKRKDFDAALEALLDFHLKLVEYSGLRTLTVLNRSLSFALKDMHQRYPPPILTTSRAVNSYAGLKSLRAVVKRIEERDASGAKELMQHAIAAHRNAVLALANAEGEDE